jgi:hypothetical protein
MIKNLKQLTKKLINSAKSNIIQLKKQHKYEIIKITTCDTSNKHLLEIKIVNKCPTLSYLAEDVAADDDFISGFSPLNIRSISYFATLDKYEKILSEDKIRKTFELLRSDSINGNKAIKISNKNTREYKVILLKDFSDSDLIDKLNSQDAYQIGYLTGQEQGLKDIKRISLNKEIDAATKINNPIFRGSHD